MVGEILAHFFPQLSRSTPDILPLSGAHISASVKANRGVLPRSCGCCSYPGIAFSISIHTYIYMHNVHGINVCMCKCSASVRLHMLTFFILYLRGKIFSHMVKPLLSHPTSLAVVTSSSRGGFRFMPARKGVHLKPHSGWEDPE